MTVFVVPFFSWILHLFLNLSKKSLTFPIIWNIVFTVNKSISFKLTHKMIILFFFLPYPLMLAMLDSVLVR
jgi:hypothetical protein